MSTCPSHSALARLSFRSVGSVKRYWCARLQPSVRTCWNKHHDSWQIVQLSPPLSACIVRAGQEDPRSRRPQEDSQQHSDPAHRQRNPATTTSTYADGRPAEPGTSRCLFYESVFRKPVGMPQPANFKDPILRAKAFHVCDVEASSALICDRWCFPAINTAVIGTTTTCSGLQVTCALVFTWATTWKEYIGLCGSLKRCVR